MEITKQGIVMGCFGAAFPFRNSYCGSNVWSVEYAWGIPNDRDKWARSHHYLWVTAFFYFVLFMMFGTPKMQDY